MITSYHIRITGPSGSGKTFLSERLAELGYPAIDADGIEDLGRFLDTEGNVREYDHDGGQEWLQSHFWSWDEAVLAPYLQANPRSILCGGAWNDKELDHYFTQVFYLVVSKADILANLQSPDRYNPYGKTAEQQAFASQMIDAFYTDIPASWRPLSSRDVDGVIAEIESHLGDSLMKK